MLQEDGEPGDDTANESMREDPRMLALFDSLVRRELNGNDWCEPEGLWLLW